MNPGDKVNYAECEESGEMTRPRAMHFDSEGRLDASVFQRDGAYIIAPAGALTTQWLRDLSEVEVDAKLHEMGIDPASGWR